MAEAADSKTLSGVGAPVLSAPVISKQYGTDLGLFDVMDATQLLSRYAVLLRQGHVEEFRKKFFESPVQDAAGLHRSDVVLPFGPSAPLLEVAQGMLRVGTHRVCEVENVSDAKARLLTNVCVVGLWCVTPFCRARFRPSCRSRS